MKKRKVNKNFDLNKRTVANLTDYEQQRAVAGGILCENKECALSNSAILYSSTGYWDPETEPMPTDRRLWPCIAEGTTVPFN